MEHLDILDERERFGWPLTFAVLLHTAAFLSFAAGAWFAREAQPFGDPSSTGGGGSVAVTAVSQIPLPARTGEKNPLASDTESRVPTKPAEATKKKAPEPDPQALQLKTKRFKKTLEDAASERSRYKPDREPNPNQLYGTTGRAAASPMFGVQGAGALGSGAGSVFGVRFGYYEQLLRQKVAQKWNTQDVDPRLKTAPPVIVTFEVMRNGSVRDIKLAQRSGNLTLDYTCQRAVQEAAPFPELPAGFERESAKVEFWFQLQR